MKMKSEMIYLVFSDLWVLGGLHHSFIANELDFLTVAFAEKFVLNPLGLLLQPQKDIENNTACLLVV